jgi:hypothetical protein
MKTLSTLFALAVAGATNAIAHPGHPAPPVHAHDIDEAAAIVAALLLVAVIAIGACVIRILNRRSAAEGRAISASFFRHIAGRRQR